MLNKMKVWKGWERSDQGWELRQLLKHIDRYDPSNRGIGRVDVRNEYMFKKKFPGPYKTLRKAYPRVEWGEVLNDLGYRPIGKSA